MPRFDMEQGLELIQKHKVTQFFAVPPIVLGLAKHPAVDPFDCLAASRRSSAGPRRSVPSWPRRRPNASAPQVVQGYGMTELSPISHATVGDDSKPGSNGVTAPNTRVGSSIPRATTSGSTTRASCGSRDPRS